MSKTAKVVEESHPDWKVFNGKAAQAVVFSNFAYQQKDDEMQELADKMPKGYEMFLMTDHVQEVGEASFRCVAFMNQNTKEIVFATAGSRFGMDEKGFADIYDDALMVAHNKPRKMNPAQILNDMVLDSLGDKAKEYKFHYTGHSLGAAMAEMQAADMDIKLTKSGLKLEGKAAKEQITAVTFENPGTKPMIEKMYEEAGLPKENISKLNFCEFNNRKNMINSLNEQTGRTYTIVPHSQKERNPSLVQMVFEYVAKIVGSEISPLLGKAFGLLAPGGVLDDLQSEHTLENFNEVFVKKEGKLKGKEGEVIPLEEAYSGVKPIKFDKAAAEELSKLKAENGNVGKQNLSMTKADSLTGKVVRLVFSNEELNKALTKIAVAVVKEVATSMVSRVMNGRGDKAKPDKAKDKATMPKLELLSVKDVAKVAIAK